MVDLVGLKPGITLSEQGNVAFVARLSSRTLINQQIKIPMRGSYGELIHIVHSGGSGGDFTQTNSGWNFLSTM